VTIQEDSFIIKSANEQVRASPTVLSMTLQKKILPSKFSYLLFFNPTHKTKTGTANRRETTNDKPPGPIRNREQQSDHNYYTLLWQVLDFAVPFTSLSKL
jgi:hypothetical protein